MEYLKLNVEKVLDPKFWTKEAERKHYSHHIHRNSPIETDDSCGNCDGANCDKCKLIIEPSHFEFTCESSTYYNLILDVIKESRLCSSDTEAENAASELTYWDGSYTRTTPIRIIDPNENDLINFPEFYEKLVLLDKYAKTCKTGTSKECRILVSEGKMIGLSLEEMNNYLHSN